MNHMYIFERIKYLQIHIESYNYENFELMYIFKRIKYFWIKIESYNYENYESYVYLWENKFTNSDWKL